MEKTTLDNYEEYEQLEIQILNQDRRYRRNRRGQNQTKPDLALARSEFTDFSDNITDFVPSYAAALDPLHHERQWLIRSVGSFYRENLITDVTRIVKGGKEANVYCCLANPASGVDLIAAKLYRPRMLRNLRNDALYTEGRILLDREGKTVKGRREARAMANKTRFGQHLGFMSWIVHEYQVQTELYLAGADVPRPIAYQGNTILMTYIGNEWAPAPALNEVSLDDDEAQTIFERILDNIKLMLAHNYVHGDLSAYNILYWEGEITIIDFPQLVDARKNGNALMLLDRDIRRVCEYFVDYGIDADPVQITPQLWDDYQNGYL
ncbi:MAG TPA: RIO1 family regulatory kinase/ATPase [Patescibacteria group bacterium]|nr:RIO1 family regulatory kinase/ATPase [Patescibacteria group bacterium]